MGSIKKKALKNDNESTYTLSEAQINTLLQYRRTAQAALDRMLQELTSVYLHELAVNQFGYAADSQLQFKLDLDKSENNIVIMPQ